MKKIEKRFKFRCLYCSKLSLKRRLIDYNICGDCRSVFLVNSKGNHLMGRELGREIVRMRDKHTCQLCKKIWVKGERRFDIHHLDGLCGRLSRSYDKARNTDHLTTLCHKCHLNLPEVREKMSQWSSPRPIEQKIYQRKYNRLHRI